MKSLIFPLASLASVTFAVLPSAAAADTLFGVYVGAGTWQQEFSGELESGIARIDVEDDLDLDDDRNNVFYAAIEHPIPVLPNVRVSYVDIESSGNSTLERTIDFDGALFPLTADVATSIEMSQTEAVLYYEVLDNVVSVDLGLAARYVDGRAAIASAFDQAEVEFSGVLPLAYAKARVDLPFTGAWVAAEMSGLAYSGDRIFDASAQIGWESPVGFGVEAGWRTFRLELDEFDDIEVAEIDVTGPYAALNFHF